MIVLPYIADAAQAASAAELVATFGPHAAIEATARADRSRDLGNVVHFCRWRQIARLIDVMGDGLGGGTLH